MYISIEVAAAALEVLVFSIYLKGLYRKYARSTFYPRVLCRSRRRCAFRYLFRLPDDSSELYFPVDFSCRHCCSAPVGSVLLQRSAFLRDQRYRRLYHFMPDAPLRTSVRYLESFRNNRVLYIVLDKLVQLFLIYLVIRLSKIKKSPNSLIEAVPLLLSQIFSIFVCYFLYLAVRDRPPS